jgi:carboxymethylenebutenolidase
MSDDKTTRRAFVTTSLATGFALAVSPAGAETITTDTNGLTAGEVKIPAKGGDMPAYRAMPENGTKLPVVLVVSEVFGVHEHIKDVCRRFAKVGYFAVAPDLFARHGDVTKGEIADVMKIVAKVPDDEVMADLDATAEWAKKSGKVDPAKLAITGFCWGGRITWLYAAHAKGLKAGGAWYGRISGASNALQPKHPIDLAAQLKAPVLGLYGGKDSGIPVSHVELMKRELAAAGAQGAASKCEIVVYPDAPHAFNADYRPSFRKGDAEDAWKRLLAFFKANGAL